MPTTIIDSKLLRTCKKCGEGKPLVDFPYSHKAKGYRRHECSQCHSTRLQAWHEDNRSVHNAQMREYYHKTKKPKTKEELANLAERQRRYNRKNRLIVLEAYGNKCACCGEAEEVFLSIDHINNNGYEEKKAGKAAYGAALYSRLIRENFPDDFQLLCMNCNVGKARNGGVCPHQSGEGSEAIQ